MVAEGSGSVLVPAGPDKQSPLFALSPGGTPPPAVPWAPPTSATTASSELLHSAKGTKLFLLLPKEDGSFAHTSSGLLAGGVPVPPIVQAFDTYA